MTIPIFAYHKVDTRFEWGINTVSPRLFEKQISFLAKDGYTSISVHDYLENRCRSDKTVIITFDDAYKSILQFAYPILTKYGFQATVFVISEYVGRKNDWDVHFGGKSWEHLTWDNLQFLIDSGWEIGSHSATHPDLTRLNDESLRHELLSSKNMLEQNLNYPINIISYPFNRFNNRVIKLAAAVGYKGGCCLVYNKLISPNFSQFVIPRIGVYAIDNLHWFRQRLAHEMVLTIDRLKQKLICFCARGTVYYKQFKKIKKNIAI